MPSPELEYLAELMRDFPLANGIKAVEEAEELLESRYEFLLENSQLKKFPQNFKMLVCEFHWYLYQNILSNAGQYRQPHDQNSGVVFFGLQRTAEPAYHGSPAIQIEQDLEKAFRLLQENDSAPIKNAVTFYQKFVHVHPFYDANGRIGKLLVSLYLDYYGYYVNWDALEKRKGDWFRKLNDCHNRQNQASLYVKYLDYLANYFSRYVSRREELETVG